MESGVEFVAVDSPLIEVNRPLLLRCGNFGF
jgi:hypothetical protein